MEYPPLHKLIVKEVEKNIDRQIKGIVWFFDIMTAVSFLSGCLSFLEALIFDYRKHPKEWENTTIDLYLEAMMSWIEDYSSSEFNDIDWKDINYSTMAKILYMGKLYE